MRISDWSSDVCSSDLGFASRAHRAFAFRLLDLLRRHGLHRGRARQQAGDAGTTVGHRPLVRPWPAGGGGGHLRLPAAGDDFQRSEEHTSELQSLMRISYAVFCLKKKKTIYMFKYTK